MGVAVWVVAGIVVLGLVIWAGNTTLRTGGSGSSGISDALGNFIDVFDPARSRADKDLKDWENTGPVIPSPDDEDQPVTVDLKNNRATIRRSPPPIVAGVAPESIRDSPQHHGDR